MLRQHPARCDAGEARDFAVLGVAIHFFVLVVVVHSTAHYLGLLNWLLHHSYLMEVLKLAELTGAGLGVA